VGPTVPFVTFFTKTPAGLRRSRASRVELFKKLKPREINDCPFTNLPEAGSRRWGAGLPAAKMADCQWLRPELVGILRVPGVDRCEPPAAR